MMTPQALIVTVRALLKSLEQDERSGLLSRESIHNAEWARQALARARAKEPPELRVV